MSFKMALGNPYSPVISQVSLPFSNPIPGGLSHGKQIQIQGIVQNVQGAEGFSINLCEGPKISPNCALHFNPRFNQGCVVRNSLLNDSWGNEERDGGMPIGKGTIFEIIIMATPKSFMIAVNGKHFAEYNHRFPLERIVYLYIDGSYMKINFVKFEGGQNMPVGLGGGEHLGFGPPPPAANAMYAPQQPPPYTPGGFAMPGSGKGNLASGENVLYNPPVPFTIGVPGGMAPNKMIFISGVPMPSAKRFTINLKNGDRDVVFHFDVRIDSNGQHNVLVRNTCTNDNWGSEETAVSHFPFMPNATFDLIVLADHDKFKVAVNNSHFLDYKHRLPLQSANTLNITGDVRLTMVRFQ